ncbi:hypothetical protein ACL7TT_09990 [Microbulbifer sp. 2304DJ12-6]|uniref:hypothetical protein n=1 Tax=Microbulbifer sp. 2304DJ12-6 TaxID=3233340 RepID=UPI0039B02377
MSLLPNCSFRIIGLSEEELSILEKKYLDGVPYRIGSYHKDRSKKVLRLILNESIKSEVLHNLIEEKPDDATHDFFVSVSSCEQTAIVDIPDFLLNLNRDVGGRICFSYTCTFDPESVNNSV